MPCVWNARRQVYHSEPRVHVNTVPNSAAIRPDSDPNGGRHSNGRGRKRFEARKQNSSRSTKYVEGHHTDLKLPDNFNKELVAVAERNRQREPSNLLQNQ